MDCVFGDASEVDRHGVVDGTDEQERGSSCCSSRKVETGDSLRVGHGVIPDPSRATDVRGLISYNFEIMDFTPIARVSMRQCCSSTGHGMHRNHVVKTSHLSKNSCLGAILPLHISPCSSFGVYFAGAQLTPAFFPLWYSGVNPIRDNLDTHLCDGHAGLVYRLLFSAAVSTRPWQSYRVGSPSTFCLVLGRTLSAITQQRRQRPTCRKGSSQTTFPTAPQKP